MEPVFEHDCKNCRFMGHYLKHDVYFCPSAVPWPTLVARFGDDGPEYTSLPPQQFKAWFSDPKHKEWLCTAFLSEKGCAGYQAIMLALAVDAIEHRFSGKVGE